MAYTNSNINQQSLGSSNLNNQIQGQNEWRLKVTVVEASNLLRKGIQSLSDPYVILSIHKKHNLSLFGQEQRTTPVKNNVNPIWNQSFTLLAQDPQNDLLRVRVFDRENLKDSLIGELDIPLFNLAQNQQFSGQQGLHGQQGYQSSIGQNQSAQNQPFSGQQGLAAQNQQFSVQQGLHGQQGYQSSIGQNQSAGQQGLAGQQGYQSLIGQNQSAQNQPFSGQQGLAAQNQPFVGQQGLAGQQGYQSSIGQNQSAQNQQFVGQQGLAAQNQPFVGQQGLAGQQGYQSLIGQNQSAQTQSFSGQQGLAGQQGFHDEWFQLVPLGSLHLIIDYQSLLPFFQQQGFGLNAGLNQGYSQNNGVTVGAVADSISTLPIQETIVKPTIIQEVIRTDRITEIQPVITRHVEQPHIHHVEKHVFEAAPLPPTNSYVNAPIIHEEVHPHIINEVQEVLHKEISAVEIQHTQELREERLVLPVQHTYEVTQDALLPGNTGAVLAGQNQQIGGIASQQGFNQGIGGQQDLTARGAEIPRNSKSAQVLEDIAAHEDRRRGVQAGAAPVLDNATGEVVQPRSSRTAARIEEKAAQVEAKHDRKQAQGRFIA